MKDKDPPEVKFVFNSENLNSYLDKVIQATLEMTQACENADKSIKRLERAIEEAKQAEAEARAAARKLRQGRTW